MKRIGYFFIFFFVGFLVALSIFLASNNSDEMTEVCVEGNCFSVELAQTNAEKSRGLMFRESLGRNEGMLFVYDSDGEYGFWMKNTLIFLDIIWIDSEMEVVHIEHNARPCREEKCESLKPGKNARFVLEINGGLAEELGIGLGDKVGFDL